MRNRTEIEEDMDLRDNKNLAEVLLDIRDLLAEVRDLKRQQVSNQIYTWYPTIGNPDSHPIINPQITYSGSDSKPINITSTNQNKTSAGAP